MMVRVKQKIKLRILQHCSLNGTTFFFFFFNNDILTVLLETNVTNVVFVKINNNKIVKMLSKFHSPALTEYLWLTH